MGVSLIFEACIALYIVDLGSDSFGYEGLHILHNVELYEVHLSWVYKYWLGVGSVGIVVISGMVVSRDGSQAFFSFPELWWHVAITRVVISYVRLISLSIRVGGIGTFSVCHN